MIQRKGSAPMNFKALYIEMLRVRTAVEQMIQLFRLSFENNRMFVFLRTIKEVS